ncbi:transposase [Patescibacteria group bacterium]|nr:transposase [Patescibacteria group bacterium]
MHIYTDEFRSHSGLDKVYASHQTVNHGCGQYVNGNCYTNTLEGWFSLLKRGVNGTYHHISEKHLDRYVDEFVFRYNNRKINDSERAIVAIKQVADKRLTYESSKSDATINS